MNTNTLCAEPEPGKERKKWVKRSKLISNDFDVLTELLALRWSNASECCSVKISKSISYGINNGRDGGIRFIFSLTNNFAFEREEEGKIRQATALKCKTSVWICLHMRKWSKLTWILATSSNSTTFRCHRENVYFETQKKTTTEKTSIITSNGDDLHCWWADEYKTIQITILWNYFAWQNSHFHFRFQTVSTSFQMLSFTHLNDSRNYLVAENLNKIIFKTGKFSHANIKQVEVDLQKHSSHACDWGASFY